MLGHRKSGLLKQILPIHREGALGVELISPQRLVQGEC
jgi:hypothetical protein